MHASTSFCQYSICCSATWARRVWSEGSPKALSFIPTSSWHFSCSGVHSRPRREDVASSGGFQLKVRKAHPEKFFAFQAVSGYGTVVSGIAAAPTPHKIVQLPVLNPITSKVEF